MIIHVTRAGCICGHVIAEVLRRSAGTDTDHPVRHPTGIVARHIKGHGISDARNGCHILRDGRSRVIATHIKTIATIRGLPKTTDIIEVAFCDRPPRKRGACGAEGYKGCAGIIPVLEAAVLNKVRCALGHMDFRRVIHGVDRNGHGFGVCTTKPVINSVGKAVGPVEVGIALIGKAAIGLHRHGPVRGTACNRIAQVTNRGIDIGCRDGTGDFAIFIPRNRQSLRHRRIVFTMYRDGNGFRIGGTVVVLDRVGKGIGRGFPLRQRFEGTIGVIGKGAVTVVGHLPHSSGGIHAERVGVAGIHIAEISSHRHSIGRIMHDRSEADLAGQDVVGRGVFIQRIIDLHIQIDIAPVRQFQSGQGQGHVLHEIVVVIEGNNLGVAGQAGCDAAHIRIGKDVLRGIDGCAGPTIKQERGHTPTRIVGIQLHHNAVACGQMQGCHLGIGVVRPAIALHRGRGAGVKVVDVEAPVVRDHIARSNTIRRLGNVFVLFYIRSQSLGHRSVVRTGNGDRCRCRVRTAISVIDRVGKGIGRGFTGSQRLERTIGVIGKGAVTVVGDTAQCARGIHAEGMGVRCVLIGIIRGQIDRRSVLACGCTDVAGHGIVIGASHGNRHIVYRLGPMGIGRGHLNGHVAGFAHGQILKIAAGIKGQRGAIDHRRPFSRIACNCIGQRCAVVIAVDIIPQNRQVNIDAGPVFGGRGRPGIKRRAVIFPNDFNCDSGAICTAVAVGNRIGKGVLGGLALGQTIEFPVGIIGDRCAG